MSTLAAIDIGTNSVRLLVADADADGRTFTTRERLMEITRLGQDVNRTGVLAPEAIERTLATLRRYREVMDRMGVERVRATATSAARDAANRDDFMGPATDTLGVAPEVIAGAEEGRLSFHGATAELDRADGPFLVVDIGGGSTEFIAGSDEVDGVISVQMGCVRFTEQFLRHDPPRPEELSEAIDAARSYLDDVVREVPAVADARTLVGVAGTITTVAAVELGLAEYDRDRIHHFHLTRAMVEDVFRTLATEARADRIHNPGLEEARADVIVGGCCVLVAIMRTLGFDELLVSEADILDGIIQSMLG